VKLDADPMSENGEPLMFFQAGWTATVSPGSKTPLPSELTPLERSTTRACGETVEGNGVAVGVRVGVWVGVRVEVGVLVVRMDVGVRVGVLVGVLVDVGGIGVNVRVGVRVGVEVGGIGVDVRVGVRVGVAVRVGVFVGVRVLVGVGVGGAEPNSKAPMSQRPLIGRGKPRWSVVSGAPKLSVQPEGLPASIAGLLVRSASVGVGPPLSCRVPTFGSTPGMLCETAPVNEQPAVV
jgi:hypothetical protein